MKRIGIITFHNADNYGAVLQNYALQREIEKMQYSVETIDYHCEEIEKGYRLWTPFEEKKINKILHIIFWRILNFPGMVLHRYRFGKFRKNKLNMSSACNASNIGDFSNYYDVCITGSDQVWNINLMSANKDAYSLAFVKGKKASYAASAGTDSITDQDLLCNIKKLDYVTVREKSLQYFLQKQDINAGLVCDPVFFLTKEEWSALTKRREKKGHIFAYFLGSNRDKICDIACYISKEENLKIKSVVKISRHTFRLGKSSFGDGPAEFVEDIANAKYVVASSFHAIVFSIIFEREFITILDTVASSRVRDLLEYLMLSDRIVTDLDDYLRKREKWTEINFDEKKVLLQKLVDKSKKELEIICNL